MSHDAALGLTISGGVPAPFLHVDNRSVMLCSGGRAVGFSLSSAGRWLEETLMIILDEGRATRTQGERVLGGFLSEDRQTATVYGGSRVDLIVVTVARDELEALQAAVTEAVHHHQEAPPAAAPATGRGRRRLGL